MSLLSSTELPPLKFSPTVQSQPFMAPTAKIGWIHSEADKAGASFDLIVKDALGRTRFEKMNCRSETKQYGELVNEPSLVGEQLTVEVKNLKGADEVKIFLN